MSTGPEMVYFPIGGRGELTRLIAVRFLSCCPASRGPPRNRLQSTEMVPFPYPDGIRSP
jgi:hypothetical protein